MSDFDKQHIIVTGRTESLPYTSTQQGRNKVVPREGLDRLAQGTKIRTEFNNAIADFTSGDETEFVYVVFKSPRGFLLDLDKFDNKNFRIASYREIKEHDSDEEYYEATVYLNKKAISTFLKKITQYLTKNTLTGNPSHHSLISNIEEIKAATLKSFWQEPELGFPNADESIWWEIWLSRNPNEETVSTFLDSIQENSELQIGSRILKFPEHWVCLMKGTPEQLASLLMTDKLSEIRQPRETADFFTYLEKNEQADWIENLVERIDNHGTNSSISVCLLDTGVNRDNPILVNYIPERHWDKIEPSWTAADTHSQGHGTPMAGLALFGDLTEAFATNSRIQLYHQLESIKLVERNHSHQPELYGAVTLEAISRGEVINPTNKRMVCLAITSEDLIHKGRPSSWSSAIDQVLFGSVSERNTKTLVFMSSGNMAFDERINYPLANASSTIQDPAQSFNAITVGAYTLKDRIEEPQFNGAEVLAVRGGMSPCNTTSLSWDKEWCKKPDIVMEGGNLGLLNGGIIDPDSLQLLSSSKGGVGRSWLTQFGDTSGATALASRFAAELYFHYPTLWPETIRGLIIHSADWTPSMLGNRNIHQLSLEEKQKLISQVGYGVPNLERAKFSANNSLVMIAERVLKPFKLDGSLVKTDEFHLFDLPWPVEVLQELFNTNVKLKITLSYFIEPNPGNRKYELAASYRSHGLRFKMIDSNERPETFKARISRAIRDLNEEPYEREGGEHWILTYQVRDKGSVHKDIWEGTAADLATRNKVAIYPVGGWWKSRKGLNRFDYSIRYSLIMSIETPSSETDIYTPVMNQISIDL